MNCKHSNNTGQPFSGTVTVGPYICPFCETERLKAERDAAVKLARDYAREAYEDVEGWVAYAPNHFELRWNLQGDLNKWLERGAAIDAARSGQ